MRIDTSNLLLAAQAQTRPAAAAKTAQAVFEPASFAPKPVTSASAPMAAPAMQRIGQKLDIKV